jgi:hypothetical protein
LNTKAVFQAKSRLFASSWRNSGTFSSNGAVGGVRWQRREKLTEEGSEEGVKQMKIAASDVVVPMLSVHKVG